MSRKIVVLKARKGSLQQAENYLISLGHSLVSHVSAAEALNYCIETKPDFFMYSVDHSSSKLTNITQALRSMGCIVISFSEMPSIKSYNLLMTSTSDHKVNYPPTGIALAKGIYRFLSKTSVPKKSEFSTEDLFLDKITNMLRIPLNDAQVSLNLGCDVYIRLDYNKKSILYCRSGQVLEQKRIERLKVKGLEHFWVKTQQAGRYLARAMSMQTV